MRQRLPSSALRELVEIIRYYDQQELGLGARFLDEVEATIDRVVLTPEAWRLVSARARRCRVRRFPFAVIYQIRKDEILFVSIMDLRRNPQRWQSLLSDIS